MNFLEPRRVHFTHDFKKSSMKLKIAIKTELKAYIKKSKILKFIKRLE